uniref:Uncharacterized protein n=1 Tax=Moorena producens (strain JHB) TaxID=1454205 RepID=A0A1D9G7D3_MOOP1
MVVAESGIGNRESGIGNREQVKNPVYLIGMENAIRQQEVFEIMTPDSKLLTSAFQKKPWNSPASNLFLNSWR